MTITQWESDRREYRECGGVDKPDEELKEALLDMLPNELQKDLIWKIHQYATYQDLRDEVIVKSKQWEFASRRQGINIVANGEESDDGMMDALKELEERAPHLADLCVAMRGRMYGKRPANGERRESFGAPKAADSKRPEPRAPSERRCANCGEKGHSAAECKKPIIAVSDRKCHVCGKKGHVANKCPDRPKRLNLLGEDESGEDDGHEHDHGDHETMMLVLSPGAELLNAAINEFGPDDAIIDKIMDMLDNTFDEDLIENDENDTVLEYSDSENQNFSLLHAQAELQEQVFEIVGDRSPHPIDDIFEVVDDEHNVSDIEMPIMTDSSESEFSDDSENDDIDEDTTTAAWINSEHDAHVGSFPQDERQIQLGRRLHARRGPR